MVQCLLELQPFVDVFFQQPANEVLSLFAHSLPHDVVHVVDAVHCVRNDVLAVLAVER
jgi:hypothetical protein